MKIDVKGIFNKGINKLSKHVPEMLTGVGIFGFIGTVVYSCKVTPKAIEILDIKKKEKGKDLTNFEVVKTVAPIYAPAGIMGVASITCFVGSNAINTKRLTKENMALASAYSISEKTLDAYRKKVVEKLGEKKEAEIHQEIAQENYNNNKPGTVFITGNGDYMCYEPFSKTYFKSDVEKIRQAKNNLNEQLLTEMYMSLNEWLSYLGLKSVEWGEYIGWNINQEGMLDFTFDYISDENGVPCACIRYTVGPRDNYKDVY